MVLTELNKTDFFNALVERLPLRPSDGGEGHTAMTGEEIRAAFDRAPKLLAEAIERLIRELQDGRLAELPIGKGSETLGECLQKLSDMTEERDADIEALEVSCASNESLLRTQNQRTEALAAAIAENEAALSLHSERIGALESASAPDLSGYASVAEVNEGLSLILDAVTALVNEEAEV